MIEGKDFLLLAETWIKSTSEAQWGSAVSRAYYAAFHEARQLLRNLGFVVPRGDKAHAYLWMRLSNCGDADVRLAGSDLNTLRRERNQADYDVELTLNSADALLQVQASRLMIQTLEAADKDPRRTNTTDAMKIYERDVTWKP